MKIIYDLANRFQTLAALESNANVINEDGTQVNAMLECCMEMYDCERHEVSFEMLGHTQKIVNAALKQAIQVESIKAQYGPAWNKTYGP